MAAGQGQDARPPFRCRLCFREDGQAAQPAEEAIAIGLGQYRSPLGHQQGIDHLQVPEPRDPPGHLATSGKQAVGSVAIDGLVTLEHPGQRHGGIDHDDRWQPAR